MTLASEALEKESAKYKALPKDYKILRYEVHYLREAIRYLRAGKLDEAPRWLAGIDKSVDKLAATLQRLMDEKKL